MPSRSRAKVAGPFGNLLLIRPCRREINKPSRIRIYTVICLFIPHSLSHRLASLRITDRNSRIVVFRRIRTARIASEISFKSPVLHGGSPPKSFSYQPSALSLRGTEPPKCDRHFHLSHRHLLRFNGEPDIRKSPMGLTPRGSKKMGNIPK